MPDRSPTWPEVIESFISARGAETWTAAPGLIQGYDAATQTADIQIATKQGYFDEAGERQTERLAVLTGTPIVFVGSITHPVRTGDSVLVVFCSASLDKWKAFGGEVDPGDERRNTLSDGVAFHGLRARPDARASVPEDAVVVWADDEIRLGGPTADKAVVVQTALDDFDTALNSVISGGGVPATVATALQSALGLLNGGTGWKARTTKTKAE